ncbi:hypothetical protein [Rubrobacter indicoceani]|uniref:hypothetical protein n=1 Tax=Rubrobacter indicoceani TaxID=2051957 RepID=UPI0013C4011E|nr:hypothetical protein [Rubrobacter indicoceani]
MDSFSKRAVERFGVRGLFASAALLVAFFLGDALLHEEAYAELGYAFALCSMLGFAAGFGGLLLLTVRSSEHTFGPRFLQTRHELQLRREPPRVCGNLPVLLTLLYSPLCALFSGLAGWVEIRA